MKWLALALRLALGAVFVYAALAKLPALDAFAEEIANYRLVAPSLVAPMAAILPGVELLAGVLLLVNRWTRAAAILTSLLLAAFIAALSAALMRGINLACGCFGGAEVATWGTVGRDVILLLGAAAVAWLHPPRFALTPSDAGDKK